MKKFFYKKKENLKDIISFKWITYLFLISLFLFSFEISLSQERFSLRNWYALNLTNSTITPEPGTCNAVYRLNLVFNNWGPAKFAILENGQEIGTDKISVVPPLNIQGITGEDGITPGWQDNTTGTNNWTVSCYLNTQVFPYRLTSTLPTGNFKVAQIFTQHTNIAHGESVLFTSNICSTDPALTYSYQWQESLTNGATWTDIPLATDQELQVTPSQNNTIYRVEVLSSDGTRFHSNEITLTFIPPSLNVSVIGGRNINNYEYETVENNSIYLLATSTSVENPVYSLQVRGLNPNSVWRDTVITQDTPGYWEIHPTQSLEYKVKVAGTVPGEGDIEKEENHLLRVIQTCNSNSIPNTLWYNDFGRFEGPRTYITKINGIEQRFNNFMVNNDGINVPIINYWAPEYYNYIKNHDFAIYDPWVGNNTPGNCGSLNYRPYRCWNCIDGGYRIEDGYYAIIPNPKYSNCGSPDPDYWDGPDHTGNNNGGMLFVNLRENSQNAIIYEQDIEIDGDCNNVALIFSCFISNAAKKASSGPVNMRLDILDQNGNVIHSAASGDIPHQTPENPSRWSNLTFKFMATGYKYTIRLINNAQGGAQYSGNDILLDDISISICYPDIELITDRNDRNKRHIETCQMDTVVTLIADNASGIENYISDPRYLLQYKKENETWTNLSPGIVSQNEINVELNRTDTRFHGPTNFRVIVASKEETINSIVAGNHVDMSCEDIYAIDSSFTINFQYSGPMGADIDTSGCVGEIMQLTGNPANKPRYEWVNAKTGEKLSSEKEFSFEIAANESLYEFYFIGYEELGCPDTQRINVKAKEFVDFTVPDLFAVCEYDSLLTPENLVPSSQTFTWDINGVIDPAQTGPTFTIPQSAALTGEIKITGHAEEYCQTSKTIPYEIYKQFQLSLDIQTPDGGNRICISSETDSLEITLTATSVPAEGKPSTYYWYQNEVLLQETTSNTYTTVIPQTGKYTFSVKAIDSICRKTPDDISWDNSNTGNIEIGRAIQLSLYPQDTSICEGENIIFRASVLNSPDENIQVAWSGDDIPAGTITTGSNPTLLVSPTKTNLVTENKTIRISATDQICTSNSPEAETSYNVHNKIKVQLSAERTDGLFCLDPDNANTILLTATPETGTPTQYEWYRDDVLIATTYPPDNSISMNIEKGANKYSVKATDGVCISTDQMEDAQDEITINAAEPVRLVLEPQDTVLCEGVDITFRSSAINRLDDNTIINWSGDDILPGTTTNGINSSLTVNPVKTNLVDEVKNIMISTTDLACPANNPIAATSYRIHNKIKVQLSAERTDGLFCLDPDNANTILLTATPETGTPTQYEWYRDDVLISTTYPPDNSISMNIEKGANKYSVKASDGVCISAGQMEDAQDEMTIHAAEPVRLVLEPQDTVLCEGIDITFRSSTINTLDDNTIINWSGDDILPGTTTNGINSSLTVNPVKTNLVDEVKNIMISTTDLACPANNPIAATSYRIHNKIKVQLSAERTDGLFCLDPDNANTILLTATPEEGTPTQYEWYRDDVLISTTYPPDNSISMNIEKGANKYSVKASDGVCISTDQMEDAQDEMTINAAEPVRLVLEPQDTVLCEGIDITFRSSTINALDDNTIINWSGDDILPGTTTNGINSSLTVRPVKTNLVDEMKNIMISTTDLACPANNPIAATSYRIHNKIKVQLSAERTDGLFCLDPDNPNTILLTATPEEGTPTQYEWYRDDVLIFTTYPPDNSISMHIEKGANKYSVRASDGVCISGDQTEDAQDEMTINAAEPVRLAIAPQDTVVCERENITFSASVLNSPDENIQVAWSGDDIPAGTITTGSNTTLSVSPTKTNLVTENKTIRISATDQICTSNSPEAETSYSVHNKIKVQLSAERTDGLFCLDPDNANTILLTATPETGTPTQYEWYRDDVLIATTYPPDNSISMDIEKGANKYSVKASDGVCISTDQMEDAQDEITINAAEPVRLVLEPQDTILCEGENITFRASVLNSPDENMQVAWSGEDIPAGTITTGSNPTLSVSPSKTNLVTENKTIRISATDQICTSNSPEAETSYDVHNKIKVRLSAERTDGLFCLDPDNANTILLTATPETGTSTQYEWYRDDVLIATTYPPDNSISMNIEKGANKYSVKASDGVCISADQMEDAQDEITINAAEPVRLVLEPQDTVLCEGIDITFRSSAINALDDNTIINWSGDDILPGTTTNGINSSLTVRPVKTNLVTENKTIRISATDQICTSNSPEAETSYDVHNKIKVRLSAERTDGLFCLDPDNPNTILLTATPETGTPTQYEWYKDDLLLLVSEQNEVNLPIEKGVSRYSVKATDGVCISGDQTGDAQDEISVEAQTPIILSLSAEKNTLCEEEELTLTARVTNTIRTDVEINWFVDGATSASHHSLALPSSNPNELISAWAFTPAKTGNQTESGTVRISSPDNICTSGTDNFLTYNVHKKIEIKLEAEGVNEQVCIRNENDKTINLKALVTKGEPSNYIWSDGQYEGQTERTATITPGENHFSVQAVDGVCNTTGTEAATTMQIDAREPITVDLSVSKGLVCLHESTTLTVTINNSFNTNTRLSWNPSSIAPSSDVSNGSHDYPYTPQEGDTYVTVSAVEVGNNICGSSVSDEVTITARDSVRLRIDASSHAVCQDGNTEITLETEVLSGKPSSITWFDGTVDPMTNKNISHLTITPTTSSNYWASATDDICNNTSTVTTDLINVTTSISLDLTVNTENTAFGDTITLTVNSSSEDHGPFNWYRSPEELLLGTTKENTFRYKPTEEGTFGFYVSTGNGYCPNVQSQIVYVSVKDLPLIPSIITPYNHNNKNDVFMGPKNGEPGYKVEIYNRYQQLIFEGEEGWDGTYKGRPADPGTYFYRLFLRNGKTVKGSLEIIKF